MNYQCVSARFLFFDGQKKYTVEFAYALSTWYIFNEEDTTDSLWWKKVVPSNHKSPNRINAEEILDDYLETLAV